MTRSSMRSRRTLLGLIALVFLGIVVTTAVAVKASQQGPSALGAAAPGTVRLLHDVYKNVPAGRTQITPSLFGELPTPEMTRSGPMRVALRTTYAGPTQVFEVKQGQVIDFAGTRLEIVHIWRVSDYWKWAVDVKVLKAATVSGS